MRHKSDDNRVTVKHNGRLIKRALQDFASYHAVKIDGKFFRVRKTYSHGMLIYTTEAKTAATK